MSLSRKRYNSLIKDFQAGERRRQRADKALADDIANGTIDASEDDLKIYESEEDEKKKIQEEIKQKAEAKIAYKNIFERIGNIFVADSPQDKASRIERGEPESYQEARKNAPLKNKVASKVADFGKGTITSVSDFFSDVGNKTIQTTKELNPMSKHDTGFIKRLDESQNKLKGLSKETQDAVNRAGLDITGMNEVMKTINMPGSNDQKVMDVLRREQQTKKQEDVHTLATMGKGTALVAGGGGAKGVFDQGFKTGVKSLIKPAVKNATVGGVYAGSDTLINNPDATAKEVAIAASEGALFVAGLGIILAGAGNLNKLLKKEKVVKETTIVPNEHAREFFNSPNPNIDQGTSVLLRTALEQNKSQFVEELRLGKGITAEQIHTVPTVYGKLLILIKNKFEKGEKLTPAETEVMKDAAYYPEKYSKEAPTVIEQPKIPTNVEPPTLPVTETPVEPNPVMHIPEKGIYSKLTPEQQLHFKDEVKNIPNREGESSVHLSPADSKVIDHKEVPIEELIKQSPVAKEAFDKFDKTNKPTIIEKPKGSLKPLKQSVITKKPKQLSLKEAKPQVEPPQNKVIKEYAEMIKSIDDSARGGQLIGNSTIGYKRVSEHSKFYSDFYAKNKKKPTLEDWTIEAERQLKSGEGEPAFVKEYNDSINPETQELIKSAEEGKLSSEQKPETVLKGDIKVKKPDVETGTPKLAEGVKRKALKEKIIFNFDKTFNNLPEYEKISVKEQSEKATELVLNNPKEAFDIAMGNEMPPAGILPESVFIAVENYAIENKNVEMLRQLATSSNLTQEASGMGQRIRMLAERNPESLIGNMQSITKERERSYKKRTGKSPSKAINDMTKRYFKKKTTKTDWAMFVESIKC